MPKKDDQVSPESKNLARNLPLNTAQLTREVQADPPTTRALVWALAHRLRDAIWGEDLTQSDHQIQLFSTTRWHDLKMATMDRRYLPLPSRLVPTSEKQLREFCQSLLSRDGDWPMRQHFLEGWGSDSTSLDRFCRELWATRANDPDFYQQTVSGDHRAALDYLGRRANSRALRSTDGVRLLTVMALIYSAHDGQAAGGRAHRAITRPLGWLLQASAARMTAGTIFAVFRPIYKITGLLFGRVRTVDEAVAGKREGKPTRHDVVATVREQSEPLRTRANLKTMTRADRDTLLVALAHDHASKSDEFWDELRLKKASGKYTHKRMTQVWYSELTPIQVVALPVLRLIQAEACLQQQIEAAVRRSGKSKPLKLPPFDPVALPVGWKTRAKLLVDDLRRIILQDCDHRSFRKARRKKGVEVDMTAPPNDDTWLDEVAEFLKAATHQEAVGKNPGAPHIHTFRLLDIAINHRFGAV